VNIKYAVFIESKEQTIENSDDVLCIRDNVYNKWDMNKDTPEQETKGKMTFGINSASAPQSFSGFTESYCTADDTGGTCN
jgi:hypothetical protein